MAPSTGRNARTTRRAPLGGSLAHRNLARGRPSIQRGFTLIELAIVLIILGVVAGLVVPKLNVSQTRADAGAQQVRSVFQTAQRTSLTRQFDVMVSIDTISFGLQIGEDANNDGIIEPGEVKYWRPDGDGNSFAIPPVGVNTPTVPAGVIGSQLSSQGGLPSITFHRDGSTSSSAEIYVTNTYKGRVDWRAITVTRATGRTELYRLSGTGSSAKWMVVQ